MNCVFRVDASHRIGIGHVMRCLTLADALRDRGDSVTFITRQLLGHMAQRIEEAGYPVLRLDPPPAEGGPEALAAVPDDHRSWLGVREEDDAEEVLRILNGLGAIDWLIVDHYGLGERWEAALRERVRSIAVFDDLADRYHDADLLIDQTAGRHPREYLVLVPEHARLLLGPTYAPLRPEFAQLREKALVRRRACERPERLLVMMGGFDPDDATSVVLQGLARGALPEHTRIEVIMGAHAPGIERVRALAGELPWPTKVAAGVPDVAQRIAAADLAVGAAGTTSWERCCLGLPSLVMTIAANQARIADELAAAGAAIQLGTLCNNRHSVEYIGYTVGALMTESSSLLAMGEAAAILVDGMGANRLTDELHRRIWDS